jgi:acyl-CoA reductase-like NAD-dependent aldehyde dehydrogenase
MASPPRSGRRIPSAPRRIGRELETGTVFMNRADYLDPALCWTGVKETGRGGSLSVSASTT